MDGYIADDQRNWIYRTSFILNGSILRVGDPQITLMLGHLGLYLRRNHQHFEVFFELNDLFFVAVWKYLLWCWSSKECPGFELSFGWELVKFCTYAVFPFFMMYWFTRRMKWFQNQKMEFLKGIFRARSQAHHRTNEEGGMRCHLAYFVVRKRIFKEKDLWAHIQ